MVKNTLFLDLNSNKPNQLNKYKSFTGGILTKKGMSSMFKSYFMLFFVIVATTLQQLHKKNGNQIILYYNVYQTHVISSLSSRIHIIKKNLFIYKYTFALLLKSFTTNFRLIPTIAHFV